MGRQSAEGTELLRLLPVAAAEQERSELPRDAAELAVEAGCGIGQRELFAVVTQDIRASPGHRDVPSAFDPQPLDRVNLNTRALEAGGEFAFRSTCKQGPER